MGARPRLRPRSLGPESARSPGCHPGARGGPQLHRKDRSWRLRKRAGPLRGTAPERVGAEGQAARGRREFVSRVVKFDKAGTLGGGTEGDTRLGRGREFTQ